MKISKLIISILCLTSAHASQFDFQWKQMQAEYFSLCKEIKKKEIKIEQYHHPFWHKVKNSVQKLITGKPEKKFLHNDMIARTMVRHGISDMQQYEILHLENCISKNTRNLLSLFQDTDFPILSRKCKEFNCSINTLGHLFYVSKILSKFENPNLIDTIVELGGGYGNLARVFKMILPKSTIIIFDLPEFISLQSLFLRATIPEADVIVHTKIPKHFKEGSLHLVPIFFVDNVKINTNVFVSTFGISECPALVQNKIINKKFFDAELCYIVGQLNGWNNKFEHHDIILDAVRDTYCQVDCYPFHSTKSYETTAMIQK